MRRFLTITIIGLLMTVIVAWIVFLVWIAGLWLN